VSYESLKQQIAKAFGWFEKDDIESCNYKFGEAPCETDMSDAKKIVMPPVLIQAEKEMQEVKTAMKKYQQTFDEKKRKYYELSSNDGSEPSQALENAQKEMKSSETALTATQQSFYQKEQNYFKLLKSNTLRITVTLKSKEIPDSVSLVLNHITYTKTSEKAGGMHSTDTEEKHNYTLHFSNGTTLSFTTPDAPCIESDKRSFDLPSKQTLYNMQQKYIEAIITYAEDQTKAETDREIATEILTYIQTKLNVGKKA